MTDDQVRQFRDQALRYIEQCGFLIRHGGLLEIARSGGAIVDFQSGMVKFPRTYSRELLRQAPSRIVMRNVLGDAWEIGGPERYGLAIVTDPWVIDYATGAPRRPTLEDIRRNTIVAEQLDPVIAISRMEFPVADVSGPYSSLRALEMHLLHHTRHYLVMAADLEGFEHWINIARLMCRGGDIAGLLTAAIAVGSPLTLNELNCELLLRAVQNGCNITPTTCPMAGSTGPYSMAGTILQSHIESLMVVLMAQVLRPGHPVIYSSGPSITDLGTGADLYYTLDKVQIKTACVQLGLAENLPVSTECGGTLTHRVDAQCGAEGMLFMLSAVNSGADMYWGFGSCNNAMGMSPEMMIIQQAYLHAAQHFSRVMPENEPLLAAETLARVGPGGHFLDDELTLERMYNSDFFQDPVFDMRGGQPGGRPMLERAHERVKQLVDGFESRVPGDVQEALRKHFAECYQSHCCPK